MSLRMRQICLVARDLSSVVDQLHAVLGLEVCHRDPGVGKYGLENALFPVGDKFLEVVAPVIGVMIPTFTVSPPAWPLVTRSMKALI